MMLFEVLKKAFDMDEGLLSADIVGGGFVRLSRSLGDRREN